MQTAEQLKTQLNRVKLLVTDIDGTLLRSDGTMGSLTKDVLKRLKKQGMILAVATGRPWTALPEIITDSEDFHYAITCNGTNIVDLEEGSVIYQTVIPPLQLEALVKVFKPTGYPLEVVIAGKSHVPARYYENPLQYHLPERMKAYVQRTRIPVDDVYALIESHKTRIESLNLIVDDLTVKEVIMQSLKCIEGIYVTTSAPYYIECNLQGAHKGNALKHLCDLIHVPYEASIAFGDSENDVDLLSAAGIGIAMGNACERVRAMADGITVSNDEEGLAVLMNEKTIESEQIYLYHIEENQVIIDGFTPDASETAYAEIPAMIAGLEVKSISEKAFYQNMHLKGITLPPTIERIEKYAFAECRHMEHIVIPDGLTFMGDYACYNCHALKMVSLPGHMRSMGYGAFKNCSCMEEVTILTNGKDELEVSALFEDTSHEIHITMCDFNHQILTKLVLTEFDYDCILQVEARQFDWVYHGSGNVFRQCITKKGIDYKKYDSIFHMAVREDSLETAIQIAADRVIYPYRLLDEYKEKYISFLKEKQTEVFNYYLKNQDIDAFEKILDLICNAEIIDRWIDLAREKQTMNFVSFLMDYKNMHYGIKKKTFDL